MQFDKEWLADLGVEKQDKDKTVGLLRAAYDELEIRVGKSLQSNMSAQQVKEFTNANSSDDEGTGTKWLDNNFPNYKDTVKDEFEKLSLEIKKSEEKEELINSWRN